MMVIFYFSSRSTSGIISTNPIDRFYIYKSFHLIEYAVLGILLLFASRKINITIFTAYLYACTDELHQLFTPGRTSKFTDTLIDLLGIISGLMIYKIAKNFFPDTFKKC